MSGPKRRARRSQQGLLRPSRGSAAGTVALSPVLVEGVRYERRGDPKTGLEVVVVPGVPGAPGLDPIPERLVPCVVVPVTVAVVIRAENRFLAGRAAGSAGMVAPVLGYSIALDNEVVYCGVRERMNPAGAMIDAARAMERLLAHPVRWHDQDDWRDRACYLDGVPSHVRDLFAPRGQVLVTAAEGIERPPLMVDTLSDRLNWTPHALGIAPLQPDPAAPPGKTGGPSHG